MKPIIKIKRIYDKPLKKDGCRILADRLWPRGLSVAEACIDDWMKVLAPSAALRTWFGHDPDLWYEFKKKYRYELRHNKAADTFLDRHGDKKVITLLHAGKDEQHTHAIVLREFLEAQFDELPTE